MRFAQLTSAPRFRHLRSAAPPAPIGTVTAPTTAIAPQAWGVSRRNRAHLRIYSRIEPDGSMRAVDQPTSITRSNAKSKHRRG